MEHRAGLSRARTELATALGSEESRTGAVEAIRALIETLVLEPDGD
jgi:hypothetical protein